jgi:hypothetical protein
MTAPPQSIIADSDVLAALRDLFSRCPTSQGWAPHKLAVAVGTREVAIEAALQALCVEGEVRA